MELSLAALSDFRPKTGTQEQWNAAYVRVEDYLRAHRIHNRLHQSRLIQKILERAARRHETDPSLAPETLAAEETAALMEVWFDELLGEDGQAEERRVAQARVAMLLADVPARWPYAFLDSERIPDDLRVAMQRSSIQAGPDVTISSMVPREIDLGTLPEVAGDTLESLQRWPLIRLFALWTLFIGVLALLFKLTR